MFYGHYCKKLTFDQKKELVTHTYDIDIGSEGDRAIKTAALQALARQGVYADTVYMCETPGVSFISCFRVHMCADRPQKVAA